MGLSIHYSGRLKNAELLPNLIEEIEEISKLYGWKYHILGRCFPNNKFDNTTSLDTIYGIDFTPTQCETISIAFLSNGVMVSPSYIAFFAHSKHEAERNYIYTNSVKTQFAGIATHALIIRLFKYLNNKYFENFTMNDESNYWETDDEEIMQKQFEAYDTLLDNFELSIKTFPMQEQETITSYFERLMKHIENLKK